MKPEELAARAHDLRVAADLVEAIDDLDLQRRRGWDLSGWGYELIPWGVRFVRMGGERAEILVLAGRGAVRRHSAARTAAAG